MRAGHLAVDHADVARPTLLDQTGKRHFRGIALPAEHRLAEEHLAQLYAVQAADQLVLLIGLHGVAESEFVELLWLYEGYTQPHKKERLLPDGSMELVINLNEDQTRLRANLREMPSTAAAYKRYLEKFDKQETEIEELQKQQKSLQTQEMTQLKDFDRYLSNLNFK